MTSKEEAATQLAKRIDQAREGEAQLRTFLAGEDFQDDVFDALRALLPKMRMSDLVGYLCDPRALLITLGVTQEGKLIVGDVEQAEIRCAAAVIAIRDEIDRRFPVPDGQSSKTHAPLIDLAVTQVVGCTCGWRVPHDAANSDTAVTFHMAWARLNEKDRP